MDDLLLLEKLNETDKKVKEALAVHLEIKNSINAIADNLVKLASNLKEFRDKKLYLDVGIESFEEYTNEIIGIGQRQAYSYISAYEKLSPKLMADNAELGITKLSMLAKISAVEREDFIEENKITADTTVKELERLIEEKNGIINQMSLEMEKKQDEVDELVDKLNEPAETIDVASVEKDIIDKAIKEALKEEKEKNKITLENLKAKQKSDLETAKKKAEEDIKKELQATTEKLIEVEKQNSILQSNSKAITETAEKLEKELKMAGNNGIAKFEVIFAQYQNILEKAAEIINEIKVDDEITSSKLIKAMQDVNIDSFI